MRSDLSKIKGRYGSLSPLVRLRVREASKAADRLLDEMPVLFAEIERLRKENHELRGGVDLCKALHSEDH